MHSSRFVIGDHSITIKGEGDDIGHPHPLLFVGGRHAYEFTVKVKSRGDVKAGVCLLFKAAQQSSDGFGLSKYGW